MVGERILVFLQLYMITYSRPKYYFIVCNIQVIKPSLVVFTSSDHLLLRKKVSNLKQLSQIALLELCITNNLKFLIAAIITLIFGCLVRIFFSCRYVEGVWKIIRSSGFSPNETEKGS